MVHSHDPKLESNPALLQRIEKGDERPQERGEGIGTDGDERRYRTEGGTDG